MPFAQITISTRENVIFRDNAIKIAAAKISASVSIGEHTNKDKEKRGNEQFEISDSRIVDEVFDAIKKVGLHPVMSEYIRVK